MKIVRKKSTIPSKILSWNSFMHFVNLASFFEIKKLMHVPYPMTQNVDLQEKTLYKFAGVMERPLRAWQRSTSLNSDDHGKASKQLVLTNNLSPECVK